MKKANSGLFTLMNTSCVTETTSNIEGMFVSRNYGYIVPRREKRSVKEDCKGGRWIQRSNTNNNNVKTTIRRKRRNVLKNGSKQNEKALTFLYSPVAPFNTIDLIE